MDNDEQFNKSHIVFFIFFAFVWYFIRRDSGFYTLNKGIVEISIIASLIAIGQTVIWMSRYYMSKVTVDGFNGSILGDPQIIQDRNKVVWAIFNTGETLEPVHIRGKLATLIVPYTSLNKVGNNYVGSVSVRRHPIDQVPSPCASFLRHHSSQYNTENVFYGRFTSKYIIDNPDIAALKEHNDYLNGVVNMRNKLLEGNNDTLIEQVEYARNITGTKDKWYHAIIPRKEEPPTQ